MTEYRICILGAGNMGGALLKGMLNAGLYTREEIIVSDISNEKLSSLEKVYSVTTTANNLKAARSSEVIIIAVKPAVVKSLIEEISPEIRKSKLLISVAAGVPLSKIQSWLKNDAPVIRVMPNMPVLVSSGATAIAPGRHTRSGDIETAQKIFNTVGRSVVLDEKYLDAVTGLSGSGPAYVFTMIEALSDGGVKAGLPRDVATFLSAQTVFGAAKMVLDTGEHPAKLKELITTPGGTTIEGLYQMESLSIRAALMNAVDHATKKAEDLGKGD